MPIHYCRWRFNSSTHFATLPPEKFYTDGFMSYASYTPKSEIDYGTLSCWATNEVGLQKRPCVFHVIPAGEWLLPSLYILPTISNVYIGRYSKGRFFWEPESGHDFQVVSRQKPSLYLIGRPARSDNRTSGFWRGNNFISCPDSDLK